MSQHPVRAVIYARYTESNFKALYGRLRASSSYTKDFLQVSGSAAPAIVGAFGEPNGRLDLTYAWPGGELRDGYLLHSSDRYHIGWPTNDPPAPWRVGDLADSVVSIEGDPAKESSNDADAVYREIAARGSRPWLLAVKLADEEPTLHLRVYFENPPAARADRGIDQLPEEVRNAMARLSNSVAMGAMMWDGIQRRPPRARALVEQILRALDREPNVLLVGPPGTGKSVALEDLQELYRSSDGSAAAASAPLFDPESWTGDWAPGASAAQIAPETRSETLVFHPSYSYEHFVAGLFPTSSPNGLKLEAKAGPLLSLAHWVSQEPDRKALLVLDEFNRGSAAAIFGDTLALLDAEKRSRPDRAGASISRPYPTHEMPVAPSYLRDQAAPEEIAYEVRLPQGLHIVAAMNSTDRSVAPLDAAMRRRFTVIRVGPDYEALLSRLQGGAPSNGSTVPVNEPLARWSRDDVSMLAVDLLKKVNDRIEFCLGEDFLLGHSLFWNLEGETVEERLASLAFAVDTKVIPNLRTTFLDQDEVLAAVLAIPDSRKIGAGQPDPEGVLGFWREAPDTLSSITPQRLCLQPVRDMRTDQQFQALLSLRG